MAKPILQLLNIWIINTLLNNDNIIVIFKSVTIKIEMSIYLR